MASKGRVKSNAQVRQAAQSVGVKMSDICCICLKTITVQIFKGSGICSDDHRKARDGDDVNRGRH